MGELATRKQSVEFEYQGRMAVISFDDDKMVSLTDLWRAVGSPENKDPAQWSRRGGKGFIEHLAASLNVSKSHIIKGGRGKGVTAGTLAHWQVALEYARYLSHKFAEAANHAFREWAEEQYDPGLKFDRGVELYRKMGKDDEWINDRFKGIGPRKELMHAVTIHNGAIGPHKGRIYPMITDAMSVALARKTTKERKIEKGLARSGNLRDHMTRTELAETSLSEMWARDRIISKGADGADECLEHCVFAARAVSEARTRVLS